MQPDDQYLRRTRFLFQDSGRRVSILIVEDDLATRALLRAIVGKMDLTLIESDSIASAKEAIASRQIDLVLLDMGLPDGSGLDLLESWQQRIHDEQLIVIIVSGQDDEMIMVDALQRGAYDYLLKPIRPKVLTAKVAHAVRFSSANRKALRLSQRLSAVVDSVPEALLVMHSDGRVVWHNEQLKAIFGESVDDIAPLYLSALVPNVLEKGAAVGARSPAIETSGGISLRGRFLGVHTNGHSFPVEVISTELQGDDENFVVSIRDLSEVDRVAMLERNFVSIVSHELRTPLTSISGSLSLIAQSEKTRLSPPGERMLEIARRNVGRLNRLIDDILDLEKINQGKLVVTIKPERLPDLLDDAVQAEAGRAAIAQVAICLRIDPDLDTVPWVKADAGRFGQIMSNLLSNAIKYSPQGGEVEVCAQIVDQERVRISVTDRGPGIPESFQKDVFRPFAQAEDPTSRRQGGTGLGLSIVKALAEAMFADISFRTNVGEGTSFELVLSRTEANVC